MQYSPPKHVLDDLCIRFVLNVPKPDLETFERIMFSMEKAHTFYEEALVSKDQSLISCDFHDFTRSMFNNCFLKEYVPDLNQIFHDFASYKAGIPVLGAIILDETHERCLLVKAWTGTSWSFPGGNRQKAEEDHSCAIRAILQKTGFNVSKLINKDEYIEMRFGEQRVRLFIVGGVKDVTTFAPQTKKEISEIAWYRLDEVQPPSHDVNSRSSVGLDLYMVAPFLESLGLWISKHQPPVAPNPDDPVRAMSVWKAEKAGNVTKTSLVMTDATSI